MRSACAIHSLNGTVTLYVKRRDALRSFFNTTEGVEFLPLRVSDAPPNTRVRSYTFCFSAPLIRIDGKSNDCSPASKKGVSVSDSSEGICKPS